MDERTFRDAMSKFATGVTIVTMEDNGENIGMTVNAFMSLSLNPKLIAVSIDEKANMYNKLSVSKPFGISILREDQKDLSMIFAKQKDNEDNVKFIDQSGVPVLEDTIAKLSCKVKERVIAGDHVIIIGEVIDISTEDGAPLLYFNSNYENIQSKTT